MDLHWGLHYPITSLGALARDTLDVTRADMVNIALGLMGIGILCFIALSTVLRLVGPCASGTQMAAMFGGLLAFAAGALICAASIIPKVARGYKHADHSATPDEPAH